MSKSFSVLLILSVATLCSALKSNDQSALDVATPVLQPGCTEMCHHLTSGPCQHPDEHNEVCTEKVDVNGTLTCPPGMYECGPRPVRSEPSPPPSKSVPPPPSATSSPTVSTSTSPAPADLVGVANPNLSSGHVVADGLTVIQNNYRISFDITIFGTVGNWGSIFHFTRTFNNCCSFGDRVPALWFFPGQSRFYWIAGNPGNGDEWVSNDFHLDFNRAYHVDLKVVDGVAYQFIDGTCVNGAGQILSAVGPTQENVKLYMSDPWYSVPNAEVTNFVMVEDSTVW